MPEEFKEGWASSWLQRGYRPVQTAVYVYQDTQGHDVVRKVRFSLMRVSDGKFSGEKTFVVQHRSMQSVILGAQNWAPGIGKEGWEDGLLYRRPALDIAIAEGDSVYLCEGEKDAETVATWGGCATTHYQGSAGMRLDQAAVLAKAARLFIVADRDVVGYQLAWHHRNLLVRAGLESVRIKVVLPAIETDKADVTDHALAGLGPRDMRLLPKRKLQELIVKHGTLQTGGKRGWGYGYEDLGEWTVTRG